MERVMGIEPTLSAWEAEVLPLNYTRLGLDDHTVSSDSGSESGRYGRLTANQFKVHNITRKHEKPALCFLTASSSLPIHLTGAILDAIMDAFDAHSVMSKQVLDSEHIRSGLRDILLGPGQLYEALRGRSEPRV